MWRCSILVKETGIHLVALVRHISIKNETKMKIEKIVFWIQSNIDVVVSSITDPDYSHLNGVYIQNTSIFEARGASLCQDTNLPCLGTYGYEKEQTYHSRSKHWKYIQ